MMSVRLINVKSYSRLWRHAQTLVHATKHPSGTRLAGMLAAISLVEIVLVIVASLVSFGVVVGAIALGVRLGLKGRSN